MTEITKEDEGKFNEIAKLFESTGWEREKFITATLMVLSEGAQPADGLSMTTHVVAMFSSIMNDVAGIPTDTTLLDVLEVSRELISDREEALADDETQH